MMKMNRKKWLCGVAACLCLTGSTVPVFADTVTFNITIPGDIISKRSKIIKENQVDLDDMSVNQLIHFIQENPSILKRPIIIDERRFQVGYNAEEIRAFIPRELRRLQECDNSDFCPQFTDIKTEYYKNPQADCPERCE